MPTQIDRKVAASRYRQIRVTATQEYSGAFSVSLYAKGLNQAWSEHACLYRMRVDLPARPLLTTDDVVLAIVDCLLEQHLPGID